jgi:hypothetical protein
LKTSVNLWVLRKVGNFLTSRVIFNFSRMILPLRISYKGYDFCSLS